MKNAEIKKFYLKQLAKYSLMPSVALVLLISIGSIYIDNTNEQKAIEAEFQKNKAISEQIVTNFFHSTEVIAKSALSVVALKFGDFNGYKSVVLPWIEGDPMIKGFSVFDQAGGQMMAWPNAIEDDSLNPKSATPDGKGRVSVVHRIVDNGQELGSIRFYSDLNSLGLDTLRVTTKTADGCTILSSDANLRICRAPVSHRLGYSVLVVLAMAIGFILIFLFSTTKLSDFLSDPLKILHAGLDRLKAGEDVHFENSFSANSETIFRPIGEHVVEAVKKSNELAAKIEVSAKLNALASQVSHDIRSPLAALTMILPQLDTIEEEKRILIRSAIYRINDIANDLLQKGKQSLIGEGAAKQETVMLSSLIDSLVSEKRIQLRAKPKVNLEAHLEDSYGVFASVDPAELKRVISNLINNSIEALSGDSGKISIQLSGSTSQAIIRIEDTGSGMPEEVLQKIGKQKLTVGKSDSESGFGLGTYHAKKTIEEFGGELLFKSEVGVGTIAVIVLPKVKPPSWFVEELKIEAAKSTIVAVDDDGSVLEIWRQRFRRIDPAKKVKLVTLSSGAELARWIKENELESVTAQYLLDYELIGQAKTGIDLIRDFEIQKQAILVTSRFEEKSVRDSCIQLGIKLIPKSLASLVPIEVQMDKRLDGVLIDDDPLVAQTWNLSASLKGKRIGVFASLDGFLKERESLSKLTPIFIDVDLGAGVLGHDVSHKIHELGFENIYFVTGFEADAVVRPSFVSSVLGKDFPL